MRFRQIVWVICVCVVISAQLAADWSLPPVQISQNGGVFPLVGKDAAGNAIAVWWSGNDAQVQSARLPVGTTQWTAPVNVAAVLNVFTPMSLTVSDAGDCIVAWVDAGNNGTIAAARYSAGTQTWSSTTHLPSNGNDSFPGVSFSSNGDALIAWLEISGETASILAARLSAHSTSWDPFQVVYSTPYSPTLIFIVGEEVVILPGTGIDALSLAAGSDGQGIVNWSQLNFFATLIPYGATFSGGASGTWSLTDPLSGVANFFPFFPNTIGLAVAPTGRVLSLWSSLLSSPFLVPQGASQSLGGLSWSPTAFPTNPANVNTLSPQVSMDAAGNAFALLFQEETATGIFQSVPYSGFFTVLTLPFAGQTWTPLFTSSQLSVTSTIPSLAVNPQGQAVVVYEDNTVIKALSFTASSKTFSPTTLSISGVNQDVHAALDPLGAGVAVWSETAGGQIFASAGRLFLLPPTDFQGKVIENRFLTQTNRIYRLTWKPSPDPFVVKYVLLRNGKKIAEIPATGPYAYDDHNRIPGVKTVYTLYAKGAGVVSVPLTVTLE
jgi:hypothetical protein